MPRICSFSSKYFTFNSNLIENNDIESSELIYGTEVSKTGSLPEPSHEGYEFAGWYLDEDFTIQITDSSLIDSPLWEISEESKTAYAKWTIKRFKLTIISATRIDGVYTTEGLQGGIIATIAADYAYYTVVSLANVCTASEGYEFVGFADALNGEAIEEYLTTGIRIEAEDREIYAKLDKRTRSKIRRASNSGVKIITDPEKKVNKLFEFAGKKDKRSINYYRELCRNFDEDIDIYYAVLTTDTFVITSRRNYEKEK